MRFSLGKLPVIFRCLKNKNSHSLEYLLSNNVEDCLSVAGIALRKITAPILRAAYKKHISHRVVIDSTSPLAKSKKGRIYAVNHRQKDDIIISMLVSGTSAYTVFGGTEIALDTLNGLGLWLYGMIMIDRSSKASRQSAYAKMKYVIENGGNIIIYPEGYWNIADDGEKDLHHGADSHNSESWLIQDFSMGIFRLAEETGCEIVPVVLHYDETCEKVCYAHRGAPVTMSAHDNMFEKKDKLITAMQTEYYNLIEKYSFYNRKTLESCGKSLRQQNEELKKSYIKETEIPSTGYIMDMVKEKLIGKARVKRHIVTTTEAFAHLTDIQPNRSNAFLFRKR